jgi:hypothetical protein
VHHSPLSTPVARNGSRLKAGMTNDKAGMTNDKAGVTLNKAGMTE